jgi:hypothetical protein
MTVFLRAILSIVTLLTPAMAFAFCGDFGFGVAAGFGAEQWLDKLPLLLVVLVICLSPVYFFFKRFRLG